MAFARAASRKGSGNGPSAGEMEPEEMNEDSSSDSISSSDLDQLSAVPRRKRELPLPKSNATAFFKSSSSQPSGPITTPQSKPSPAQSRPKNGLFGSSSATKPDVLSDGDEEVIHLALVGAKRGRGNSSMSESAQESPSTKAVSRGSRLKRGSKPQPAVQPREPKPAKKIRRGLRSGARKETPVEISDAASRGSEDDEQTTTPEPAARRRLVRGRRRALSDDEESDEVKVNQRGRNQSQSSASASDDSEVVVSSARKRQRPSLDEGSDIEASAGKSRQEKEDLDEDLDFLRSSSPPGGRSGSRKMSVRDERRMLLERMKARRASKGAADADEAEEQDDEQYEGTNDDEDYSNDYAGELHDEEDKDLEGFVLEDDPDDEAANVQAELPLEFSAFAHKSLKEYFTHVVEWMVQNKLNPAFPRSDPLYKLSFRKVNNEVQGYASSKFTSTTWHPDFIRAMQARPEFNEQPILQSSILHEHCAACGRTSHPATFVVTFTGKAYDPETLELLKDSDGSSSSNSDNEDQSGSESDDQQSVDFAGNTLLPEGHEFLVGRFCKQNSYRAHALTHWRFHLNSWVLDWLSAEGYLDAANVVEREHWSTKKRNKYANRVMDDLAGKELPNLWRDFKIQLETAKEAQTYERYARRR